VVRVQSLHECGHTFLGMGHHGSLTRWTFRHIPLGLRDINPNRHRGSLHASSFWENASPARSTLPTMRVPTTQATVRALGRKDVTNQAQPRSQRTKETAVCHVLIGDEKPIHHVNSRYKETVSPTLTPAYSGSLTPIPPKVCEKCELYEHTRLPKLDERLNFQSQLLIAVGVPGSNSLPKAPSLGRTFIHSVQLWLSSVSPLRRRSRCPATGSDCSTVFIRLVMSRAKTRTPIMVPCASR